MEAKQNKTFFFTRYLVNDMVCDLIIDRKYWINMVSTFMVEKLGLPVSLKDSEFNDMPNYLVTKQVQISFTHGEYKDEVLCDVLPSKTRNFLLGRPWRHNRHTKYDHRNNTYSISHENRQISIVREEVHQHQLFKREIETKIFVEGSKTKISTEESEAKITIESYIIEEKQERLFEKKESENFFFVLMIRTLFLGVNFIVLGSYFS
jgi:hypothetical protein